MFKVFIKKNSNKEKCKFIQGDELDCAFCKYKNTEECKNLKRRCLNEYKSYF